MSKKIQLNDAKCTGLKFDAPVQLKKEDGDEGKFLIEAYTGEVVERWWGFLAIAVDGIHAKEQIPILLNHDTDQIVGYSQETYKDGSFFVSGKFSEVTEEAQKTKALAAEGFPWQASIGVRPLVIVSLEKDGEMSVNGKTLKGPGEVWVESEVFETSFVPLGADSNTSVATFSHIQEVEAPEGAKHNPERSEIMITLEQLEKDAPDLLKEIQEAARKEGVAEGLKEGAAAELARIKDVSSACLTGHEDLIEKLMWDGKTTGAEAALQIIQAEKEVRLNAQTHLNQDTVPAVTPSTPADPAAPQKKEGRLTEEEFKADTDLSAEFGGDFGQYEAYLDAVGKGLVRAKNK